jgi:hypothetical protein
MSDEDGGSVGGDDDGIAQVAEELGNLDGSQMMVPQMPIRKLPSIAPFKVEEKPLLMLTAVQIQEKGLLWLSILTM